jgi:hypothetical protein
MATKLQGVDIKNSTEIVAAGATIAALPTDDQIYVSASSINKTLKQAIIDGDIGSSPTIPYYNGYFPNSSTNYWSTTSSTLANFTPAGSIPSPSTLQSSGLTVSGASSSRSGISFTAPRTGVIEIMCHAIFVPGQIAGAAQAVFQLTEIGSSTGVSNASYNITNNASLNSTPMISMSGFYSVTASSSYEFSLKGAVTSGATLYIGGFNTGAGCLFYSIKYLR